MEVASSTSLLLRRLLGKCEIYFENSLISKEELMKAYFEFLTSDQGKDKSVDIGLHTGSICFDVISLLTVTVKCLLLDDTRISDILLSLKKGEMVLYGKERWEWDGFCDENKDAVPKDGNVKIQYASLKQLIRKQYNWKYVREDKWHLITPYMGDAKKTGGAGVRQKSNARSDFLSHVFGINDAPDVTETSVVIVSKKDRFERMVDGLKIRYGKNKSVGLLDIVTASYYSNNGNEVRYKGNAGKNEPFLKITEKMSIARRLVLSNNENEAAGLIVLDASNLSDLSELSDVLNRKKMQYAHMTSNIDSDNMIELVDIYEGSRVFACTKEFLIQNNFSIAEDNRHARELMGSVDNIVNGNVCSIVVEGGPSWDDYKSVLESLLAIRRSEWNDKDEFLRQSRSLMNLFLSAVFTSEDVEEYARREGVLISSPMKRIVELEQSLVTSGIVKEHCLRVLKMLNQLRLANLESCPKGIELLRLLDLSENKRTAVVVQKQHYGEILSSIDAVSRRPNTIVSYMNRFDGAERYDEIISTGSYSGKRFNPYTCHSASEINVLLYGCEGRLFEYKKKRIKDFERKMNLAAGIIVEDSEKLQDTVESEGENTSIFESEISELDDYIEKLNNALDPKEIVRRLGYCSSTQTTEVSVVGVFSDSKALFSEYYKALIYDTDGNVSEVDAKDLKPGDIIIFMKRDAHMRNSVDSIYQDLIAAGKLDVVTYDKALRWKAALRDYMKSENINVRELSERLDEIGKTVHMGTMRQWVHEDSVVIRPQKKEAVECIAKLTRDAELLGNFDEYYDAGRLVVNQRKAIIDHIKTVVVGKLRGAAPPKDPIIRMIYDDVQRLSEILELESIQILDEPISVPTNIVNRPIGDLNV